MRITLKQLQIFAAIAKHGNMTVSAQLLHLTQSACSMAITTLEKQLNGPLFERHGKRLLLNERGRLIYPKIINILAQINELEDLILKDHENNPTGHLIIGASSTIGNYVMPALIGNFLNDYPKVQINLRVANTEQVIHQLASFEIDIGIIEGHCHHSDIAVFPWMQDELIIIAAANHPLSKKRKISLNDLHDSPWILRETGSGTREHVEAALSKQINPFLELGHTEAIKQAVIAGLGLSCLSRITVQDALKHGDLVQIKVPKFKIMREFYILLHHEKYQSSLLSTFIQKGLAAKIAMI